MITFILNQKEIRTELSPGILLLDFIRYHEQLTGTKIGCREGDCGACTILIGEIRDGKVTYNSATSCLMAIGNVHGKHIVTIEGINLAELNAVQQAFAEEGATQCGFCTPGFVVSLAGYCISDKPLSYNSAIDSMNGNICRCTGYKSIERAAERINSLLEKRDKTAILQFAVDNKFIPPYFMQIQARLSAITANKEIIGKKILAGGTDLYVQQHETMPFESIHFLFGKKDLKSITWNGTVCEVGAAITVSEIAGSTVFKNAFPFLSDYIRLISSTQIRNMATVGGNLANASPIGDLTILFLALNAVVKLNNGLHTRTVPLKDFYKGYKILDKTADEYIESISFLLSPGIALLNFEKVSKRTCLDIASVNSAIHIKLKDDIITEAHLSAGGVGPVPLYLAKSSSFLVGKTVSVRIIEELVATAQTEISPISDARGTAGYKRLLLSQLIKAHFITLFPLLPVDDIIKFPV